jgi:hypothetical protein
MTDRPAATRYYILVLLLLILVGCRSRPGISASPTHTSIPYTFTSTATQIPTSTPVVLENGWYLYNDPDGEFSFAYPPTALISAGQNPVDLSKNITIQFLLPEKTYQGVSIRIEPNPKRLQGAEIAQQLFEKSAQKPATTEFTNSLQTIQVGGISAVQTTIPSSNTEVTIIVPYDVKVLIVSPVHETSVTKVEQETLDLFYQILNSMKFSISQ